MLGNADQNISGGRAGTVQQQAGKMSNPIGGSTAETAAQEDEMAAVAPRVIRTSYNRGSRIETNRTSQGPPAIVNTAGAQGVADMVPVKMFADADAMRERIHENIDKKDYDVSDFYYETGCAQAIARSGKFGTLTLAIIGINAVWIGLDAECNDPTAEGDIPGCPVQPSDKDFWSAGEQVFCGFFTFELLVRFGAFQNKLSALRDNWFKFDSILVFFMVVETWIVPLILGGDTDALSDMALLRMLRLLRLTRMVRLMRSVPELVTLLKGMVIAAKSVSYTLLLLLIFMYIFSIIFKSELEESESLKDYFDSIPRSMWTLLLAGCLLDDISKVGNALIRESVLMAAAFIMFVLLSSLMVLNMLIGVLCAVVTAVAAAEKEKALVNYVKSKLINVLQTLDEDQNGTISKKEFDQLVHIPQAVQALDELGVDVPNLVSLSDHLFEGEDMDNMSSGTNTQKVSRVKGGMDDDRDAVAKQREFEDEDVDGKEETKADDEDDDGPSMTFADFLEMVIRLRSENTPSVADIVELRKLIFKGQRQVARRLNHIEKGQLELERNIRMICEQLDSAQMLSQEIRNGNRPKQVQAKYGAAGAKAQQFIAEDTDPQSGDEPMHLQGSLAQPAGQRHEL
mmetsp:Transcript_44557/g.83630  ORF Transcript_44557/g.83630 Transcript_44557/m.83630 type:complete len:626 (-) Transcript_44557:74-1951(-)